MTTTIDMTDLSAKHTSAASGKRVRRRRWSEVRLQAYGMIAIFLAAAALVTLLWTVVSKTANVLTESYVAVDTRIEVSDRDLERLRDPNPRVRASLNDVWREGLLAEVPNGENLSRSEMGELFALISRDAGLELGDAVKSDLSLIGDTYRFEALLDDQVQRYMKGGFGKLHDAGTAGALEVEPVEGEEDRVQLTLAPQALTDARLMLRDTRAAQARRARAEAARQDAAVQEMQRRLATARDEGAGEEEIARIQSRIEGYEDARQAANARADALLRKATDQSATFTLTDEDPSVLIRANGGWIKVTDLRRERATGTVMEPLEKFETAEEGTWKAFLFDTPEADRNISDRQIVWLTNFERQGMIENTLNWRMLLSSDSSNAEVAGIWGALVGSFWTMVVTFVLAFPIGVMASIYLEEFAPKNRFTDFIEININNLAAVPSIVFGLLGITVLISGVSLFGVDLFDGLLRSITEDPRSTPLAGGVVLALMSLPTIIIAGRASIKAVPPSIRDAALGLGASKLQTATHHVLPLAMPGILTGSIIAMAQALGETAPLIIIGMNSFIQEAPATPLDKGNVLPSLIYLWNSNSEWLFNNGKTAAAISVLLIFLIAMNGMAVLLRKQFERRW